VLDRSALEAVGALPDAEIDIAGAAIQLARIDAPDADWQAASAVLSEIARDAADAAAAASADRVAALARIIHDRHGFDGDRDDYENPANANLIRVIERRRGLPVALGILWLHAARAAGWMAHGINFPGHFLIALPVPGAPSFVVDVFVGGQVVDEASFGALLERVEGLRLGPGLLRPMTTRDVLLRLQNNIRVRRRAAGDAAGAFAALEDMLRIAPDNASLWLEAAVAHRSVGQTVEAIRCFDRYVDLEPEGTEADRARRAAAELRGHQG
jgi:regulator of sirC expression with transglutaminase-like and TPR domain